MAYRIGLTPQAEADLDALVAFIAQDRPQAAQRFSRAITARVRTLSHVPYLGAVFRRREGIRYLVHSPYLIIYRIDDEVELVEVLRFWHGARSARRLSL